MKLHGSLLLVVALGCSSKVETPTAPAPISVPVVTSDYQMLVLANANTERVIQARFAEGAQDFIECTSEVIANCRVYTCKEIKTPAPGTAFDPGPLTVSSPSIGTSVPIPLSTSLVGFYQLDQLGIFADGEKLQLHAPNFGADVEIQVPAHVVAGSFGDCPFGAPVTTSCNVATSSPIVTWSNGGDLVEVSVTQSVDIDPRYSLGCSFDGAKNQGQIPAEALARLPQKYTYTATVGVARPTVVVGTTKTLAIRPLRYLSTGLTSVKLTY